MRFSILALLLAGCATQLHHESKGQQEYDADIYECMKDSAPVAIPAQRNRMILQCMTVKGWRPR